MATALALPMDDAAERLDAVAADILAAIFTPPPVLTVSQWADAKRVVPSYSAEPGRWVTEKTPYLREVMDSFSDPAVNKVVFMKCARIGATEAGLNVVGFFIDQDPSPIFIVQPTVDDAKDFSKEQLTPTIEETDALRQRVSGAASRDSGNTIQAKIFPGGAIYLVGANSPRGFRRRTARLIVLEEVDGYPPSAGTEGDQIKLAERRATTFQHRRKIYLNSTPTLKGLSRIEDEFDLSDQRRYFVACPDCAHEQTFKWSQLKWDDDNASTAAYCCEGCGVMIPEKEKFGMVARGKWQATSPGRSTRGFHINALYSPWISWSELVQEWIEAQGNSEKLQVFINTALGESWEERGANDPDAMYNNRRESYDGVPKEAGLLTAGVDVQHDRIEIIVRAWAKGEESFLIERIILFGDPSADAIWKDLDAVLFEKEWVHESGAVIKIYSSCVDSGDQTERVLKYCAPRFRRRVYAVKGGSKPTAPFMPKKPSRNNKYRCPLFVLGPNAGKKLIYGRIKILGVNFDTPTAYRYRFNLLADKDYFEQLTAEKAEKKQLDGQWVTVYTCPAHKRNEVLDCEVYALAALNLSNMRDRLGSLANKPNAVTSDPPAAVEAQEPSPDEHADDTNEQDVTPEPQPTAPKPRPRSNFVRGTSRGSGWKIR
jgi:phage terminase large subunit GpA-like protein